MNSGWAEISDHRCSLRGSLVLLVLLTSVVALMLPETADATERHRYRKIDQTSLYAAVYRAEPGAPVVVMVHGGSFRNGSPHRVRERAASFHRAGWTVVVPEYRLACRKSKGRRCGGRALDATKDIRAAVSWARQAAADGGPVSLVGFSAGGFLAQRVAVSGPGAGRPDGVASWSGPSDLRQLPERKHRAAAMRMVGCRPGVCPARWNQLRPIALADRCASPILFADSHADAIPTGPMRRFARRLRQVHVTARVLEVPGSAHGAALAPQVERKTIQFLRAARRVAPPDGCVLPATGA